ncbi:glyoxalase superfamily protein [Occultella kanbiaonis]|uniref:glyoxalase superfamily protein n=1 Tax=Occultella kanbiaonis TaxID=2675754 RepID=UPI0015803B4C|nr:glyoxalase superfamily protein [Occultella kanbiaonis]
MNAVPTSDEAKAQARRLRTALAAAGIEIGHSAALELLAKTHGLADWNTLAGTAGPAGAAGSRPGDPSGTGADHAPATSAVIPILRMFDWDKALAFYVGYLGWTVDWGHRFADHLPRYVQVSSGDGARLHLSEHHGDGTPGTAVLIEVADAAAVHAALSAKDYPYAAPGLDQEPWGLTVTVSDPFGNRLTFLQTDGEQARADRELPPIVTEVRVPLEPGAAYDLFTSFGWWVEYGREGGAAVTVADEVVFENSRGRLPIGRVLHRGRPSHWAMTFTLAQDPAIPTRLDAHFTASDGGTLVRLEHGGWDARNAEGRAKFTDWPVILGHFEAAARAGTGRS